MSFINLIIVIVFINAIVIIVFIFFIDAIITTFITISAPQVHQHFRYFIYLLVAPIKICIFLGAAVCIYH